MTRPGRISHRDRARLKAAIALHRAGKLDEAEPIYRSVLAADPSQPDALHFLGVLEHQRGHTEQGLALIRRATERAPAYVDAWVNIGNLLKMLGRLQEAEAAYRRALALQPGDANAHNNLAVVLNRRGDTAAAEAACRQALALDPRHVAAYTNLGWILRRHGREEEAIAAFRAAIAYDPTHPDACRMLGLALIADGRIAEAREIYERWLKADPANPVAQHMLAACSAGETPAAASEEYVRSVFDAMAESFDAHLADLDYRAPRLIEETLARKLGPGRGTLQVLDAGCGTGLCARFLRAYAERLVGVDLSPGMLRQAQGLGLYGELVVAELGAHMRAHGAQYDLVVSGDTFCYLGDLGPPIAAARSALRDGGALVFTVEHDDAAGGEAGYRLAPHGRFVHAERHVRAALDAAGMVDAELRPARLRNECRHPVAGLIVWATVPAP